MGEQVERLDADRWFVAGFVLKRIGESYYAYPATDAEYENTGLELGPFGTRAAAAQACAQRRRRFG